MVKKSTWIILIIFLVLVVGMLLIDKYPVGPFKGKPTATPQPVVIESIDFSKVTSIEVISEAGNVQLDKTSGTWELVNERSTSVSQEKVEELLYVLEKLDSKAGLDPDTPMDVLGLTMPNQTIILKTATGTEYSLSIGAATATGSGFYAQVNGGTPQIISSYAGTSLARFVDPTFFIKSTPEP